ncbi:MAG: response regulator [Candidatus Thiodiazotropha sp. (ex. Lucinisca nassula)]|nr:response regulator [Candidatus Thiodiazotropha sp. (ex. Lucinisca nassula)]
MELTLQRSMNNKLDLELAKESYKLATKASIGSFATFAAILYFFWGLVPTPLLTAWVIINIVCSASVFFVARQFEKRVDLNNANRWLRLYSLLVLVSVVPWGFIGPLGFMIEDEIYHMLTLFILGGVTAGGIITRAVIFKNYVLTLFSLLTPTLITLLMQGTALAETVLILILIYMVFMLWVAKSYSRNVKHNIQLWLDNEKLLGEVRDSHAEIAKKNLELTNEIEQGKKIESQLIEAKERSERASEAKNQFLANVSHELRTPLNGIMGFTELLQEERLEQKHDQYVSQIGKAAKSLLHIVNDILDITSIESGQISLNEESFTLRTEMEEVLAIMGPIAERKSLLLKLRIDKQLHNRLYGDANRLRQIISNLLSNAIKYTESGYVSLTIKLLNSNGKKILLRFEVEDTGIGIAEAELSTIFDNFTRVENFETRKTEGAGLGLAIVKSLVEKMDGVLDVSSSLNEGSCFSLELPLRVCSKDELCSQPPRAATVTQQQRQNFHVLVVDDNEINRMLLCAFLSKLGSPYAVASNGYEALAQIRNNHFDVVLMDIQMPDISGMDVASRLRSESRSIPILIATTAHAFPEQHQTILEAGFSDLLTKPVGIEELEKTLAHAFSGGYTEDKRVANTILM